LVAKVSRVKKPARSSLVWTDHENGFWSTMGSDETHWEIRDYGRAAPQRFGITVAHWDHPDWWAPTLEEAKALAAEVDARPPIPESEQVPDRIVVIPEPGSEYVAYSTTTRPPAGACSCGTDCPAEAVKPRRESPEWWDDPSAFWRCPACGTYRGDASP